LIPLPNLVIIAQPLEKVKLASSIVLDHHHPLHRAPPEISVAVRASMPSGDTIDSERKKRVKRGGAVFSCPV
jgi:hypothetical protein